MTVAAATREAVRARPFLYDALRAGVVNYAAAAEALDVDAAPDAVATALRRFAADLEDDPTEDATGSGRVTMTRGVGVLDADEGTDRPEPSVSVGGVALASDAGDSTAVLARGEATPVALERVLGRLRAADVPVTAAGVAPGALAVVVDSRHGADALRTVESVLEP